MLVKWDFEEIEVTWPAASDADLKFVRELIEGDKVPDDSRLQVRCAQVLTPAREDLIKSTDTSVRLFTCTMRQGTFSIRLSSAFRRKRPPVLQCSTLRSSRGQRPIAQLSMEQCSGMCTAQRCSRRRSFRWRCAKL
ncbi:hypothetical protein BD309DRAFT_498292 [Dichomitus squalens]|uniref:Uncharacterized protein n=1 Tax=Dichomitus squalens TaxID=114155 RepID=A0A4Q9QCF6_9APHY|nr:hypothetical protein BD309DRAFT_498292 [Dichomitus squalens]TBU65379.1 hypothetical protein BD310DRAFT_6164 [Dichomitus squalens]